MGLFLKRHMFCRVGLFFVFTVVVAASYVCGLRFVN